MLKKRPRMAPAVLRSPGEARWKQLALVALTTLEARALALGAVPGKDRARAPRQLPAATAPGLELPDLGPDHAWRAAAETRDAQGFTHTQWQAGSRDSGSKARC